MKIVSGKSFFYSCMVLVSGIFISACGDSDTPSVVNPPLESSSSVEDIDPSIESSADATSSESTTPSIRPRKTCV